MAGGQLSARQKMINLMYLIFIAMLAMNMGKKVLTSFGRVEQSLDNANKTAVLTNAAALKNLNKKANDQPLKFRKKADLANNLSTVSGDFYAYLQSLKEEMRNGETDFEKMDNSTSVDKMFFLNGKETPKGQEFQRKVNEYREAILKVVGTKDVTDEIIQKINTRFVTPEDSHGKHGVESWLMSNYEGFPLIASVTNVTKIQNDIKATENEVYTTLLAGELIKSVSMKQYQAMVVFDKNAYYPGEQLKGKIVLGKNDPTLKAHRVVVNGRAVPQSRIKSGQVALAGGVGSIGEHEIKGTFTFMEDGKPINIKIEGGKYSVIPMPNQAIISADKMNVVYMGVDNPISVSMPGVDANKIHASATGLTKSGKGYIMRPPGQREITINVSATLPSGKKVNSSKLFRIKQIPAPTGLIRGQGGFQKMSKAGLANSTISAVLKDFVFDLPISVASFKVRVPGKPTISCRGGKFSPEAKRAIGKAKRKDLILIFDIKALLTKNSSYRLKNTSQVSVEITS